MEFFVDVVSELAMRHLLPVVVDRLVEQINPPRCRRPDRKARPGEPPRPRLRLVISPERPLVASTTKKGLAVMPSKGSPPAPSSLSSPAFEIVSHVPGRTRFFSALLRGNRSLAVRVEATLRSFDAVWTARVNPRTGSVLVEYDADVISAREILGWLERQSRAAACALHDARA